LERELQLLGGALDWPATPPVADAVGQLLAGQSSPRRSPLAPLELARWRFGGWRPARRAAVLGLVLLLLAVAAVAGIGFALRGLRIEFGGPVPGTPLPASVVAERGFGLRTDLATATARLGTLLLPGDPALGGPDHVYYDSRTGAAALAWGSRPGFPADATSGLSVVITEFRASIAPQTFVKVLYENALLERTTVRDAPAYWVSGGQHFFFFRGADGEPVESTIRLVGATLMWEQDGLTLRIEGAGTLAAARRIATSMRQEP
jgi:hypothetical protein